MGIKTSGLPRVTGFGSSDNFIVRTPAGPGLMSGAEAAEFFRDSLRISRPNLLDNPDFTINQRGVSGTISTPGYFLDRWKLTSGSVTISSGGITLNGTIQQILETAPSGTLTASYLTNSGVQKASYDSASKTFSITASNTLIKAAKLELGSGQTLAHLEGSTWVLNDPPPNKALDLAKCQRHQIVLSGYTSHYSSVGIGPASNATRAVILIPVPASLREKPAINFSGIWNLVPYGSWSSRGVPVASMAVNVASPNAISIYADVASGLTEETWYELVSATSDSKPSIVFDSNL